MANVYEMITERILAQMQKGIIPWNRPWAGPKVTGENAAIGYNSRRAYSLLNQWLLEEPGEYLTFNEIQKLGGKVRKGEKSKFIVFYTVYKTVVKDKETGEDKTRSRSVLRYYNVFHINQTEGIPSKIVPGEEIKVNTDTAADKIITDYVKREASLKFINNKPSDKAYYQPSTDTVVVPMPEQYSNIAEYYSTTFHELVHSTSKEGRCNRRNENGSNWFGGEDYSREELVAEIGSAMLCSYTKTESPSSFKNSVGYLQGWVKSFKEDKNMIVWAAKRAQAAVEFILG